MLTLTIASGKGGTGKTTFAVNLAYALTTRGEKVNLLDCDVEEPNAHLFLNPVYRESRDVTVLKPSCDATACVGCGACAAVCNYNAIALVSGKVMIFNELCHSCGACVHACQHGAMREATAKIGVVKTATADLGSESYSDHPLKLSYGLLDIGESLAPTVVNHVKRDIRPDYINIIDASPGTACPVVAGVTGANGVIMVTEPTPFGLHDLKLAVALTAKLRLPTAIVINRSDGRDSIIADYAVEAAIPIVGRIPFQRHYAEAYSEGAILAQRFPEVKRNLLQIFDNLSFAIPKENAPPAARLQPREQQSGGDATDYREIVIVSGKGGTGKTTITAAFAMLADEKVLADNDVDAADLHLLLQPRVHEITPFFGGSKVEINPAICTACGLCAEICHFDAIHQTGAPNQAGLATYQVSALHCEGCGLCPRVCPVEAISSHPNLSGEWYLSSTAFGPMVHAQLGVGEENSGRLVAQVRQRASQLTRQLRHPLLLGDGPPGTGCPAIAAVTGADLVVVVTEPTLSGLHDLRRVLALLNHFSLPARIIINKYDLNLSVRATIKELALAQGADLIGEIPFDTEVNNALLAGKSVIEHGQGAALEAIRSIWYKLAILINSDSI